MKTIRVCLLVAALAGTYAFAGGTLGGCGNSGGKCAGCDFDEGDCKDGYECRLFSDGLARCAKNPGDTCRGFR